MENVESILEELLREAEEAQATTKLRLRNPYALHLIKILWPYQFGVSRMIAIQDIWRLRSPTALPMPKKFEQTVQSAFQQHASESKVFRGAPNEDLFFWPEGKGTGKWAVRRNKVEPWLRQKKLELGR
jgi:hypothetical protein